MSGDPDDAWLELSIECPHAAVDALVAWLSDFVSGGASIEEVDHRATVRLYLRPSLTSVHLVQDIRAALSQIDPVLTAGERLTLNTSTVHEQDWADCWKQYYHAMRVGGRLVIKPEWEPWPPADGSQIAQSDDLIIEMEPGMAFGTGTHASTRLCLEALERLMQPGMRVADVGCGSGILSIAAVKLGAGEVFASDLDPNAVTIARQNCELNGVAELVTALEGSGLPEDSGQFDLIIANISAPVITILAHNFAEHLATGGHCVLSGFTQRALAEVRESLVRAGLHECELTEETEWLGLTAQRGADV